MMTCYDIVQTLIRTEKATALGAQRKYVFQVSSRANKIQIKEAVEEIYNVKVDSARTCVVPPKRKRVRRDIGHTTAWKKAIVTLKEGQAIDVT
jgi:large subunit ribosomal protein L23